MVRWVEIHCAVEERGVNASVACLRAAFDRRVVAFAERAVDDVAAMIGCLQALSAPPSERNPAFSQLYSTLTALRRDAAACGFSLVADICALCRDALDATADERSEIACRVRPCLDEVRRLLEMCVDGSGGPAGEALLAQLRTQLRTDAA